MGTLYLVATPIGNLEDITLRAINVLKAVEVIACEDTRRTIKLCNHYDVKAKLTSYHEHNEHTKSDNLVKMLLAGKDIALVSDAGTPAISDPGTILVKKAIENNIKISPVPGPSAFVAALIASGLPTSKFMFYGFLSKKNKEREQELEEISHFRETIILYISPHSYKDDIIDLFNKLGNRRVVIARELTKIYEEFIRGNLNDSMIKDYQPKGEMCLVIEGSHESIKYETNPLCDLRISEHLSFYADQDFNRNEAMKMVAKDRGLSKNEVYKLVLKEKKGCKQPS